MDADGNRYGPYDIEVSGSEAEALTEEAWFDLFEHLTGVLSGGALTFAGLTATLTAIDARVHGSYLIREAPWSAASAATATASPRRDMLVGRRQRTSGEGVSAIPGKTFLTVLQGTPAATPADPTSFDPVNDEALWSWQVPGGGGTVVTDIRDLRRVLNMDWQNLTMNGSFVAVTAGGERGARCMVKDRVCHFTMRVQGNASWAGGASPVTFPVAPKHLHSFRVTKDNTDGIGSLQMTVGTNGVATLNAGGQAGNDFYAAGSFPLD